MTPTEVTHNLTIPGWFSGEDITELSRLASTINHGTIIEIGSMHGRSAYCLSKSSPTSRIFCLDFWGEWMCRTEDGNERSNSIDVFKSYTTDCPNVTPIQVFPNIAITPQWEEPVDMVFIDASHLNPGDWELIEFWLPKIRTGGIICGHDYYYPGNHIGECPYPDVVDNCARLEEMLGKKVTVVGYSAVWSFVV